MVYLLWKNRCKSHGKQARLLLPLPKVVIFFKVTLDGLLKNSYLDMPFFSLPKYITPYEFCRWGSCRGFSGKDQSHLGKFRYEFSDVKSDIIWKGYVSIFDREKFSARSEKSTIGKLHADLVRAVNDGLAHYGNAYDKHFQRLFKSRRELLHYF